MKIYCILLFLFLVGFTHNTYSQNNIKFSPLLSFGLSARSVSFELKDYATRNNLAGVQYDIIDMTRVRNFIFEGSQNVLTRNLFIQISGAIRYGHVQFDTNKIAVNKVKYDAFLDLLYIFKKRKNQFNTKRPYAIAGIGYGIMNMNTKYNARFTKLDLTNNTIYYTYGTGSFCFTAPRIFLGMEFKRLRGFAVAHLTPDFDFKPNATIWLEFKITYNISPWSKK